MPGYVIFIAAVALVALVAAVVRNETRASAAARAKEAARDAALSRFFAALAQEGILHTASRTLTFKIEGIARTTPILMADRDARPLRFVAPYACRAVHRSEPTGWGDWSWTDLHFLPSDCACGGPQATLYRFRPYRFDHGDGLGPDPIAAVCLRCHEARGEDGMDEDDIAFVHRCRTVARAASRGASLEEGPYRSAA